LPSSSGTYTIEVNLYGEYDEDLYTYGCLIGGGTGSLAITGLDEVEMISDHYIFLETNYLKKDVIIL